MNDNANLYSKYYCNLLKDVVNNILDKYLQLFGWQKQDVKVLDVGSAEGTVSLEVLLPKLPTNFSKLVLSDISENLLNAARSKISHPRIDPVLMDIASTKIPKKFVNYFDYIFSFYCLNCVAEERQAQALKNIYEMLTPGGTFLLVVIVDSPVYKIYEKMMENNKWNVFLGDYKNCFSPYRHLETPDKKLRHYLESIGFMVQECKSKKCLHSFSNLDDYLGFTLSIVPYEKEISENYTNFIADLKVEMQNSSLRCLENSENLDGKFDENFEILVAFGFKPQ